MKVSKKKRIGNAGGNALQKIAHFFDFHGNTWINVYHKEREVWYEYYPLLLREKYALSLIQDESKETAIDIGCGTGHALIQFRKLGFNRIIGVDISKNMLDSAKKLIDDNKMSDSIELLNCDVRKLDMIEPDSVDVCTALGVIEYLEKDKPLLSEVYRILKPNGVAVIQTRNCNCIRTKTIENLQRILPFYRSRIWYRIHKPSVFRKTAEASGFKVEREKYAHYYALYPFDIIPGIRTLIRPVDNFLSKKLERLSDNSLSLYLSSMYILKLRKLR